MKTIILSRNTLSKTIKIIAFIMLVFNGMSIMAQQDSSYKNTVRINITNPLIFGSGAIILGYERVIDNDNTFSVNIGRAYYPKLINIDTDSIGFDLKSSYKDMGINLSADYRIYLRNENKYNAPRGVYVGPYYSYNYFNRTNNWALNTNNFQGDLQTDLTINIHTVGFQLGYQFVFWNRIAMDMILIGPGVSYYSFKAKLNTSLSPEDESAFFEALNNFLSDKIPGYDQVIDDAEFKTSGSVSTTSLGFRYMIMIGYRF